MKYTPIICLLLLFIFPNCIKAQRKSKYFEIGIANDNDMYLLQRSDRYYTNGVFFNLLMAVGKDSARSSILDFELGHSLYTGVKYYRNDKLYWDRQFLGILSIQSNLYRFINTKRIIRYSFKLEQIGPKVHGESIQNFIHDIFNMYEMEGWNTQLTNSFGLDVGFEYDEELFKSRTNNFAISTALSAVVGTHNINARLDFPFRIGKLKQFNKSVFTKGNLNDEEGNNEFYFFYKPSLTYQFINSSFGDSYSVKDNVLFENKLTPIVLANQIGVTYAKKNSTFILSLTRYNNEIENLKHQYHQYGRLQYSHRF